MRKVFTAFTETEYANLGIALPSASEWERFIEILRMFQTEGQFLMDSDEASERADGAKAFYSGKELEDYIASKTAPAGLEPF